MSPPISSAVVLSDSRSSVTRIYTSGSEGSSPACSNIASSIYFLWFIRILTSEYSSVEKFGNLGTVYLLPSTEFVGELDIKTGKELALK